jgi:hypothetical protein
MGHRLRLTVVALIVSLVIVGFLGVQHARAQEAATPIAEQAEDPSTASIEVTVVDDDGNFLVSGVTVVLFRGGAEQARGTTNGQGIVSFSSLAAGTYTIEISGGGFPAQQTAPFELGSGEHLSKTVVGHTIGTVLIRVIDERGDNVAGVEVTLLHDGDNPRVGRTDLNGAVGFGGLAPGTYSATIAKDKAGGAIAAFSLRAGEQFETTATLLPYPEVEVFVTDEKGAVINGATVSLQRGNEPPLTGTTAVQGDVIFSELPPGSYSGTVKRSGYGDVAIPSFDVALGDELRIEIKMPPPPPGAVRITITDPQGVPLRNVEVELYAKEDNQFYRKVYTDSAGQVLIGGLKAQVYYAEVGLYSYVPSGTGEFSLTPGTTVEKRLHLSKFSPNTPGFINISVSFAGTPIVGARVFIYGPSSFISPTDYRGQITRAEMHPGLYVLRVTFSGGQRTFGPYRLDPGEALNVNIDLSKLPSGDTGTAIILTFTDAYPPGPRANVRVTLTGTTTSFTQTLVSDRDGAPVFRNLPPGDYSVDALALDDAGIPTAQLSGTVTVHPGVEVALLLQFKTNPDPGTASLSVLVVDDENQPIAGADVSVVSAFDAGDVRTGRSGYAFATGLPPGDFAVNATADGYWPSEPVTVTAEVDKQTSLTIQLSRVNDGETPTPVPGTGGVVQLPSTGGGTTGSTSPALAILVLLAAAAACFAIRARILRR